MKKHISGQLAHKIANIDMYNEGIKLLSSNKVIQELPKREVFEKKIVKIGYKN